MPVSRTVTLLRRWLNGEQTRVLSACYTVSEKCLHRFYLLSPNTSYAGEYTWQGEPRSACETILKDTGIAREEWQMGVTKAFIKNPETVRVFL